MEPLKDAGQRRSSSHYSVKYESGEDGNVEWSGVSALCIPRVNVYYTLETTELCSHPHTTTHTDLMYHSMYIYYEPWRY